MPVAFVQEFKIEGDDRSTANYDAIAKRLNTEADPPEGGIFHTAGYDEQAGVFRIFDVWETREHCERFLRERLQPVLDEMLPNLQNPTPPQREGSYELHDLQRL